MIMGPQEATSTVRGLLEAIARARTENTRPVEIILSPQGVLAVSHYFESLGERDFVDLSQIMGVPCRVDEDQVDPWVVVAGPSKE